MADRDRTASAQRLLKNSTAKVTEAVQMAVMELANMSKAVVSAEMILWALFEQKDSVVIKILDSLKLDVGEIRRNLGDLVMNSAQELPSFIPGQANSLKFSDDIRLLFEAADSERQRLGDGYITTAGLFLGAFESSNPKTATMLNELGLNYDAAKEAYDQLRGSHRILEKDGESRQSYLDQYTIDITAQARRGELDPVIGRISEIDRAIQILSRRKKNNPILIGEPGVGKTVIVEGLAQRIANGDVPEYLLNKRVLSLEIGSLIAGAKMQGEFEDRLKHIKDEISQSAGEIILFIDEIHTVVGAGRSGGGLDASNMLKPALAKGQLQCIGATTLREFKQYIESDKALERRFQPVRINEPSVEQTITMLKGLKVKYEKHHQIEYSDAAVIAAAELSHRYITSRQLPDKAIDLLDEAGASKRLRAIYVPADVRQLEKKRQELLHQKTEAFEDQNFESMAKIQMELVKIESELNKSLEEFKSKVGPIDKEVTVEDIAEVVSRQTGIPAKKMVQEEAQKLLNLEVRIQERLVGQKTAVSAVANAVRRNRAGLRQGNKPIASFLFLGPSGVGKTELAKAIAAEVLDDESKIIRIDMSEFMERHEVSKLIGSPPGYVGYGEGGQLTEQVKHNPYSVVLLDEFEKAHADIYNLLLQVLDEGWLTDAEGNRVSFQNCVIIGTSNIGSEILTSKKRPVGLGTATETGEASDREAIMDEVKKYLRPEFINRLDDIIVFNRLGEEEIKQILNIQLKRLADRIGKLGHKLEVSDLAKAFLLKGLDLKNYGARPLRRKIEQNFENEIASLMIARPDLKSAIILIDIVDGKVDVRSRPSSP